MRALGYALWQSEYRELPTAAVRVLMRRMPVPLDSIVVGAESRAGNPLSVSPGAFLIDSALVRVQPVILETDILRSTLISPSASAPSDWVSVPHVRGGASHGTPVLLDGVRLFNPFHVGGFLSAFNAEAISRVTLFTGSSGDAQSIGSLSGAIDVATRDGDRDRRRIGGSLGIASTRLSLEGPIGRSMSYLVDARRTYIDLVTRGLESIGAIERGWPYWFGDVHAKITADLGGVERLSLTGYFNDETLETQPSTKNGFITESSTLRWGNGAIAAHYRGRIGTGTLFDVTVGHSRFSGNYLFHGPPDALGLPREDTVAAALGRMSESQVEVRATHFPGGVTINGGVQARKFLADHVAFGNGTDGGHPDGLFGPFGVNRAQNRLAGYANARVVLSSRWFARMGARADHFPGLETTLAPFVELAHDGMWWEAWATMSRSHQALSSLRNDESLFSSLLAFDLLAPVANGPVPRNTEVTMGWAGTQGALHLRLEAYARRLENLRVLPLGFNPAQEPILGDDLLRMIGRGTARGVAGRSAAYMLVGSPHRSPNDHPPVVDAILSGPDWSAAFSETAHLSRCGIPGSERWPGPVECLRAGLPEPIREAPDRIRGELQSIRRASGRSPDWPALGQLRHRRRHRVLWGWRVFTSRHSGHSTPGSALSSRADATHRDEAGRQV